MTDKIPGLDTAVDDIDQFNTPIPGASLTTPVGASPIEQPPQFVDPDEAMGFIANKLTKPRQIAPYLATLKAGATVESVARTLLFQGVSTNKWTPDLAMMMLQPTLQMGAAVAERARQDGHIKSKQIVIMNPDLEQEQFMGQFSSDIRGSKPPTKKEIKEATGEELEQVEESSSKGFLSEQEV